MPKTLSTNWSGERSRTMSDNERKESQGNGAGVAPLLARHGGLSYLEIPALDAGRSAAFYEKVLGWRVDGHETDEPKFHDASGHLIGRWVTGRVISRDPGLLPYIYVDHIDDVVAL